ncbi:MAG: GGDEF domain-containing protein [Lachnospiraceae bacterium]|nr:GGDEF domain-containing protein [Lachnospiraceae bacterium]
MDELKYQIDYLTAINDRLVDSDRMHKFIACHSGQLYLFQDFSKGELPVLIGPWYKYIGESQAELTFEESRFRNYIYSEDLDLFLSSIWERGKKGIEASPIVIRSREKGFFFRVESSEEYSKEHKLLKRVVVFTDITDYMSRITDLEKLAYYYPNTRLYNSYYFNSKLQLMLKRAKEELKSLELLLLDVDDFRELTFKLEPKYESELMEKLALILRGFIKPDILLGQLKKDVFALAIFDPDQEDCAASLYQKVGREFLKPVKLSNNTEYELIFSAGVSVYPDSAKDIQELLFSSELALYDAKRKGKNRLEIYNDYIIDVVDEGVVPERLIRDSILYDDFHFYFEPQYQIADQGLRGADVLIVLSGDSKKPPLYLNKLVSKAENKGLLTEIGNLLLDRALRQYSDWVDRYGYDRMLSISIYPLQLDNMDMIGLLERDIKQYDLKAEALEILIDEDFYLENPKERLSMLAAVKKLGFNICLNGYRGEILPVTYLKKLPFDSVKFNYELLQELNIDDDFWPVIKGICNISKNLNIELIADGIENSIIFDTAMELGCGCVEGKLLSKAVAGREYERIFTQEI